MNRWLATGVLFVSAATASAGIYDDLYRGLQLVGTPTDGPLSLLSDGSRVNGSRLGRLRFVPNRLGKGYNVEFDRTFGADSRGRPEVFDLGAADLTLAGSVQSTLSYTSRWFLTGTGDTTINNLQYRVRSKTGAQDFDLSGTLNGRGAMQVNQFGFYTLNLDVQNTNSTLTVNGVAVRDSQDTQFDIGPINVQGNIYFDALIGVLNSLGADTTELQKLFPNSAIDEISQSLQDSLRKSQFNAKELNESSLASAEKEFVTDARQAVLSRLFAPIGNVPSAFASTIQAGDPAGQSSSRVPEPSTIALIGVGAAVVAMRVSRR